MGESIESSDEFVAIGALQEVQIGEIPLGGDIEQASLFLHVEIHIGDRERLGHLVAGDQGDVVGFTDADIGAIA